MRSPRHWAAVAVLCFLVAGCGGTTARPTGSPTATLGPTATPVPAPASVYVAADDGAVYALAMTDGAVRWKASVAARVSVVAVDDTVVLASAGGRVYALDKHSGKALWDAEGLVPATSIYDPVYTLYNHIVYTMVANAVTARNETTGLTLWRTDPLREASFPPDAAGVPSITGIEDGVVYVSYAVQQPMDGAIDGFLYAFRASDGSALWRYHTGQYTQKPVVADAVAYFAARNGVYAFEVASGVLRWYSAVGFFNNHISIRGSKLYVSGQGPAQVLDLATGQPLGVADPGYYATDGRYGYVLTGNSVAAYSLADGALAWKYTSQAQLWAYTFALGGDGRAYVADHANRALALNVGDGQLAWQFQAAPNWVRVVPRGPRVFVESEQTADDPAKPAGHVYALDGSTGTRVWQFDAPSAITSDIFVDP